MHCIGLAFSAIDPLPVIFLSLFLLLGSINGVTPPSVLASASSYTGTLSASVSFGTLYAATAYQDRGTTTNTQAVTFTYQDPEGGGGVAVGLRWSKAAQQGVFAFIDTNASPPVIKLYEMLGVWSIGSPTTSSSLSLTDGNSYTLVIADDGTTVTASIIDNSGLTSRSTTPTVTASNTEVMFGWVGVSVSHVFNAQITLVTNSVVETPTI